MIHTYIYNMFQNLIKNVKLLPLFGYPLYTKLNCDYDKEKMFLYKQKVMKKKQFNELFPNFKPVKIIGNNKKNFQYKLGLNKNNEKFKPFGYCEGGGLYFTDITNIFDFVLDNYGDKIAFIDFVNDSDIFIEDDTKVKTNEFIITKIMSIQEYMNQTPEICLEAVKKYGYALKYVENQTPEICLEAVKNNGYALQYVENQTHEICLEAVKKYGVALQYVKKQTPKICLEAVKNNGFGLSFVKNQTPEICLEAVKNNGYGLLFVKNQTPEICLEAVKNNGYALQYVKKQTHEICLEAVKKYGDALQYVENQTPEICLEAVKNNGFGLSFVKNQKSNIEI